MYPNSGKWSFSWYPVIPLVSLLLQRFQPSKKYARALRQNFQARHRSGPVLYRSGRRVGRTNGLGAPSISTKNTRESQEIIQWYRCAPRPYVQHTHLPDRYRTGPDRCLAWKCWRRALTYFLESWNVAIATKLAEWPDIKKRPFCRVRLHFRGTKS